MRWTKRRSRAWGLYLVIFLPICAGVGGAAGFALGRPDLWGLAGGAAGVLLSVLLAVYTPPEDLA